MEPIQPLLARTLIRIVRPAPLTPEKVQFAWRWSAGPTLARVSTIELDENGVLSVSLDDGRWRPELQRSLPMVLERLRAMLSSEAVTRIEVQVRPVRAGRPDRPTRRTSPS